MLLFPVYLGLGLLQKPWLNSIRDLNMIMGLALIMRLPLFQTGVALV